MAIRTTILTKVAENSTAKITATVVDENGVGLAAASLTTITLTLYLKGTPATKINSRDDQDVKNTNGVTISSAGALVWTMEPDDNPIIDNSKSSEDHIALFEWTYNSGAKAGKHEVEVTVQNLANVT